ncbi:LtrC-like protein [Natrinema sp. J7-2]|nr:LtrC-like protein [Natrinema sp. J7-2]
MNDADLTRTFIHEHAHAILSFNVDDTERSRREVKAEAIAYVVGRYCGLATNGSAFYLAAWEMDDPEVVCDRLDRISRTIEELTAVLDNGLSHKIPARHIARDRRL